VKILVVHPGVLFSVGDVHNGIVKGLKAAGHEVGEFNLADRIEFYTRAHVLHDDGSYVKAFTENAAMEMAAAGIETVLYQWWPDVVIIMSGFYIPPKTWGTLARRPHHVVYWCTESPYEDDRQARAARYADTVILNDPTNLAQFREQVNPRTYYLPHSYDPAVHFPGDADPDLACDFAFVGTGFPSRISWLERVDWSGVDVRIGGNWKEVPEGSPLTPYLMHNKGECMDNADTARLYRSAKVSLNLYRKEHSFNAHADGWAMGPREVELAACGTFFFRESRPEGDDLFPSLPILEDPETFARDLRWWLTHDDERNAAAAEALGAIADRTFKNTAARLLDLVERAGAKIAA
jgi:spore maturation protein CgeB